MSYLVDALRKAERERHARQIGNLYAASAGTADAPAGSRAGPWLWLVALLVACNVALAVYVWRPRANQPPPTPMVSAATVAPTGSKTGKSPAAATAGVAGQSSSGTVDSGHSASNDDHRNVAAEKTATARGAKAPASSLTRVRDGAQGSVRYSKSPLADSQSPVAGAISPDAGANLPDQDSVADAPTVTINGQLYSTVPGRSFILVGGRRYHEGQRLAAGPAVVSIDPDGATLLYRGHRYHVSGPG